MTEDDRGAGLWQGDMAARVSSLERQIAIITDHATRITRLEEQISSLNRQAASIPDHASRITKLESRQSVMWSGLAASVLMAAGAVFKLWAAGGF